MVPNPELALAVGVSGAGALVSAGTSGIGVFAGMSEVLSFFRAPSRYLIDLSLLLLRFFVSLRRSSNYSSDISEKSKS
jgi:hypothetical protein